MSRWASLVSSPAGRTHCCDRSWYGPDARGTGLGSALVAHAESHARSEGISTLYLLTTTAERFFAARGYVAAERAAAPATIRDTREFADICPISSAFMQKCLINVSR